MRRTTVEEAASIIDDSTDPAESGDSLTYVTADIRQAIRDKTRAAIADLEVIISGDTITLTGRTRTFYAKQLAQHEAMPHTRGLRLRNEIEVE